MFHERIRVQPRAAIVAVVLAAAVVRFWGLGFGLPHWWARPDEESVIVPAVRMVQGHLNPHWFHWPSLYMYVLAVPYALYVAYQRARGALLPADLAAFYFAHPASFQLIDRALSATFGAASVFLLYRLARLFFLERTATLAALFLALAPLHVRDSHFGVTDVPATFVILLAVYATCVWYRTPSRRQLTIASICCGLAASTKYNAALVVMPVAIAIVLRAIDDGERRRQPAGEVGWSRQWRRSPSLPVRLTPSSTLAGSWRAYVTSASISPRDTAWTSAQGGSITRA